jgi:hypothetical protein
MQHLAVLYHGAQPVRGCCCCSHTSQQLRLAQRHSTSSALLRQNWAQFCTCTSASGSGWYSLRRRKSYRLGPSFSNTCATPHQRNAASMSKCAGGSGEAKEEWHGARKDAHAQESQTVCHQIYIRTLACKGVAAEAAFTPCCILAVRQTRAAAGGWCSAHHADMAPVLEPLLELDAVPVHHHETRQ